MQGDVTDDVYPIPDVYQRIFKLLLQIRHWLVDSGLCWSFCFNPHHSTANGCKMMVH